MSSIATSDLRDQFPMLQDENLVYLDSAATSLTPQCVIDAISNYYSKGRGTVHRAVYDLAEGASALHHQTREKCAKFINASSSDEIVFTKGTTDSINLLANSLSFDAGDEILVSAMEHHSNIVPWQAVAKRSGAVLRIIPVTCDGDLDMDAFEAMLGPKTRLVSIAHMTNVTGTIYPVKDVIEKAHTVSALVMLDGAQAAPHLTIDVQALDVDFYAFSGHKLYGPTGVGVFYGKYEHLEKLSPYQMGSDMIDQVSFKRSTFQKPPLKFEAGTPAISSIIGLGAAFDFVSQNRKEALTDDAQKALESIPGLKILGNPKMRGPLFSFTIDGLHPLDVGMLLNLKGICVRTGHLCSQPTMQHFGITEAIRISFGLYTTTDEIERFKSALLEVVSTLLG